MEMTVEQMALEERKFLHDLSNHLVVAQGILLDLGRGGCG